MKRASKNKVLGMMVAGLWVVAGFAACSASPHTFTNTTSGNGGSGGTSASDAGDEGITFGDSGGGDGSSTCPSTCAQLGANCGAVTDTACGGIVMCGSCGAGMTCGGAGTHNVCGVGSNPDACAPLTCASQNVTCGPAGDGCNGMLSCGTCTLPQTCGGDPNKPGQCGCTGLCAQIPTCPGATTTTITGTVWDPAAVHPLYNALVYIPNNPADPGLQPFPAGISCDVCGATAAGNPLVSTYTAPDGTFTLNNVPVGSAIPLVVQLGRWRRQFTYNVATSCGANAVPAKTLTMPKTHLEGDIPRIAILTGGLDPVECVLRKMGIADSEFTNPGGGGHINFFTAYDANAPYPPNQGSGSLINASTPAQAGLFAVNGTTPVINGYDMVILECEGYPQTETASDLAALLAYVNSGGRVFASDFAWSWLSTNGNMSQAAHWGGPGGGGPVGPVTIDLVSNPKGPAFDKWLEITGVSSVGSDSIATINPAFQNTSGVVAPTQQWLHYNGTQPLHFTYNTPVGAASMNQCGRVVFSDWHSVPFNQADKPKGAIFPAECGTPPTPPPPFASQETILEFMLFDLSACVQPYTPICTPKTCAQENIGCGPASDGCGGLLNCGPCPMGQFCGGAGPGKCGTSSNCVPETCPSQGIECGPAGDGCGHQIDCGNCPTGEICGANGPGKCGKVQ